MIGDPLCLDLTRDRELGKPALYLHLRDYILAVVFFEQLPFARIMLRQIADTAAIGFGGRTRYAEVSDQRLACGKFLFILRQSKRPSGGVESCGVTAVQAVELSTPPLGKPFFRRVVPVALQLKIPAQAVPFKGSVIGMLYRIGVKQVLEYLLRKILLFGEVHYPHRRSVETVSEQENLEGRALGVPIEPGFSNVDVAVCLDIDREMFHFNRGCRRCSCPRACTQVREPAAMPVPADKHKPEAVPLEPDWDSRYRHCRLPA